ncbi:MAG: HEPN domain-containing protein [Candidatus Aminicenantia bacterium]
MNSEKLSASKMWEKIEINKELVKKSLSLAERDIKTAKNIFKDKDYDWCLAIAYNAMLQAGRALMFSEGYRPKGEYKHVAVIEFVKSRFGREFADQMLFTFNKTRKKRHIAVYEQVDIVSKDEARNVLNWAEKFVNRTKEILEK